MKMGSCQDKMRLERLDLVTDVLGVLLLLQLHVGQRDIPEKDGSSGQIEIAGLLAFPFCKKRQSAKA